MEPTSLKIKSRKVVSHLEWEFIWNIPDFDIESPYASAFTLDDKIEIEVNMRPFSGSELPFHTVEPIWCFNKVSSSMMKDKFHLRISCVDDKLKKIYSDTIDFLPIRIREVYHGTSRHHVSTTNLKYCLDKKKALNLKFELTVRSETKKEIPIDDEALKIDTTHTNALKSVVGDDKYADFDFYIDDEKFPVHKAILAARSDLLNKIFAANDKKEEEKVAIVTGVSKGVFKAFISYIYSDILLDAVQHANGYLTLAEKFEFPELKKIVEKALIEKLTEDTASDAFKLAHRYGLDENLKISAFGFIKKKFAAINQEVDDSLINDPENVVELVQTYEKLVKGLKELSVKPTEPVSAVAADKKE